MFVCRLYQVFYGLVVCPWYAYSQTMISEVSPLPQMYVCHTKSFLFHMSDLIWGGLFRFLFFALFSVVCYLEYPESIKESYFKCTGWENICIHWPICIICYHHSIRKQ